MRETINENGLQELLHTELINEGLADGQSHWYTPPPEFVTYRIGQIKDKIREEDHSPERPKI